MEYDDSEFAVTLSAAAGDDAALHAELRACFIGSMQHQFDLLQRARCDGNWLVAARRLLGLGSSFNAPGLMALAREAEDSAPGDPVILRKLRNFVDGFPRAD